ncbi:MAG: hypothetical protein JNK82_29880 [Myxococcaceae bacterium]|nr:hypothetical protein [Myxococcaceae bacterium]
MTTTRLDGVVLDYDTTTSESMSKLLLLNIARAHQSLPMHFTAVSNIVATYRFAFSGGIGPAATGDLGWLPVPQVGGGTEENPTVSIAPMQGDEFTQRLLTPFQEQKLTLLLRQGYDVDALLRLLGAEVRIEHGPPEFIGVHRNRPSDKEGYALWRRVVSHLSSIQDRHHLSVEPLHFQHQWVLPAESVTPESFETTLKEFSLTFDPAKRVYTVTKRVNGRVMISNYDPAELTDAERRTLHAEAEEVPFNDVLIDIRAGRPGGELPLHGRLRLRSFHEVLTFVGRSIEEEQEVDVKPDARTPNVTENPVVTLGIAVSDSAPGDVGFSVRLNGRYYAVKPEAGYPWNLKAFALLSQLFEMSVANVVHTGPAITIAK